MRRYSLIFILMFALILLVKPPMAQAAGIKAVPLYHLAKWVPGALAHFYTADEQEKQDAIAQGWGGCAIVGYVSPIQLPGMIPLYRLYYGPNYDHYYTADPLAKDSAVKQGWTYECITGYVLPTIPQSSGTVPLYQKYDSYQHIHFYATTPEDTPNYKYESYVCRIWNSATTLADLNVTSPMAGADLTSGTTQEIKWTTTTSGGNVGLYISPDSGLTWKSITTIPVENTGSMSWQVPTIYGSHVRIKAEWDSGPLYPYTTWVTFITGDFTIDSPSSPPSVPASNLVATPKGSTEIDLSWKDNSTDETGFSVERKTGSGVFAIIAVVGKNKTSYADTSVTANTTYTYRIRTWKGGKASDPSNEVTVTASSSGGIHFFPGLNHTPLLNLPLMTAPASPSTLSTAAFPGTGINLSWTDNSNNETGFVIERKGTGNFAVVGGVGEGVTSFLDSSAEYNVAYTYRVKAISGFGESSYSNEAATMLPSQPNPQPSPQPNPQPNPQPSSQQDQTTIILTLDNTVYTVNGEKRNMDVAPVIMNDRTMLPIKYVTEPLGAKLEYFTDEQKVKISLGTNSIELWINKNNALINGTSSRIDVSNPDVVPIVVPPGRTLLPISFIAHNLGCQIDWNPTLQQVTIAYPKP